MNEVGSTSWSEGAQVDFWHGKEYIYKQERFQGGSAMMRKLLDKSAEWPVWLAIVLIVPLIMALIIETVAEDTEAVIRLSQESIL